MSKKVRSRPKASSKSSARRSSGGTAVRARQRPGRKPASLSLASLPTAALAAELKRRRSEIPKLEKQAARLRAELAAVEARIAALGEPVAAAPVARATPPAVTRGKRTRNGQPTIGEQIADILGAQGGVMRPVEIAEILGKRLAREVNQNFLVQISLTLARMVKQGRVAKVGRGQYSAKGDTVASND